MNLHHVISDGWSIGVLIRELGALYRAGSRSEASPLGELPIQYADFAHWQRGWLRGEVLEKQLDYWRARLGGGTPLLELPTDRPRPAVKSHRGETVGRVFPAALLEGLNDLSRQRSATLFMTLL